MSSKAQRKGSDYRRKRKRFHANQYTRKVSDTLDVDCISTSDKKLYKENYLDKEVLRKINLASREVADDSMKNGAKEEVSASGSNEICVSDDVIDEFSKFTWLYPTRSTDAAEATNRLENQRHVFGNPARIITDKGSAFTSSTFEDYCDKQNILHISITTGLPRSNGQIEKQNSTIIAVLSKLSVDDPEKWYFFTYPTY
ncbi:transposon Ty3-I Gag-Pol polyprotein [Trichonephila clavipes]|nr:transposon Ty3-I Gag-Pol polyprotein [Trichonephila clavipes]